ncbi:protein ImuB [Sphaerotilus hippei]|uniref:Protein ImuB n=2 Tax=Sphaerotilus hippei TaxID=744406 RepID=A0A318H4D0_9BURK|nr:protein ImuB [Sphaerotilus hippei]
MLPLDALGSRPEAAGRGALVWDREHGSQQVRVADAAAQALGVRAGQHLGTARALAPQALVLARQPERETALLERLALSLGVLTPALVLEPPDVLLELHASLRLFGGVRPMRRLAHAVGRGAGVQACSALAATPLAARLLARQAAGRPHHGLRLASTRRHLQPLRLEALLALDRPELAGHGRRSLEMLQALGARRLADLHQLPRAGLQRRGAGAWLELLDRAEGRRPDPPRWWSAPQAFSLSVELPHRAESVAPLEAAVAPLVTALCGWLALRWLAAQRLVLVLRHEHGARRQVPDEVLEIDLATPSREARHLLTVLRERLQRLPLAAAVDSLRLELGRGVPDAGRPGSLLPDPQAGTLEHATLIDRLRARLGHDRVMRLRPQADARPEKAEQRIAPEDWHDPANPAPGATTPPRPVWLLDPPRPLAVHDDLPLHQGRPLQLLTRAERIETGWHDTHLVRRDYHVALGQDGVLHWVYREHARLGEPLLHPPRWFLHGLFG